MPAQVRALERLTKPSFDEAQGDEGGGEVMEGGEDVEAPLGADGDAAEPREPRQRALDLPAVAAEAFTGLDAAARDAGDDGAAAQRAPAARAVVALVGTQLGG